MRDSSNTGQKHTAGRHERTLKYKMDKHNWRDNNDLKVVLDKIGTVYKLLDRLGEGGYAKVYKVYHRIFEETRVLKIMDSEFILHKLAKKNFQERRQLYNDIVQRFMREANLYNKIDHPNIVKINEIAFVKKENNVEVPYLIMPYLKGINLADFIKQKRRLDFNTALGLSKGILAALHEIHSARITHRDMKPGNIIIDKLTGKAVLIDFGLAKQHLDEADPEQSEDSLINAITTKDKIIHANLTSSDQTMGTPQYMPPEQFTRMKDLGPGSDIYSFGVILFEMLTGVVPLGHENPQQPVPDIKEFNPSLPPGIQSIISKTMAKKPQDRYKTVKELLNDLEKVNEDTVPVKKHKPAQTTEISKKHEKEADEEIPEPKRKFPVYSLFSLLALIASIIIAAWLIFKPGDPNKHYRELIDSANQYMEKGEYEKAQSDLNKARKINDTGEVRWLLERAANKQKEKEKKIQGRLKIEKMKEDYEKLQEDLKGSATRDKKIEHCRAFLETYKEIPATEETTKMISGVQDSLTQLETDIQTDINKDTQYRQYINRVKSFIKAGNYKKASEFLQQAKQIKDTPEVSLLSRQIESKRLEYETKNGTLLYNSIKEPMTLKKYLEFKAQYPDSDHLPELEERMKASDPALPPKDYWDKPIKKNDKGYYEYRFGPEHNGHIMIYIPRKNYWIDKYEVSNLQFGNSLQGDYPAVVEYEDAVSYCQKYGFKLPTESEWEYAASGGKNIDYPWGNEKPDENGIYRANYDSFDDGFMTPAPVKSFEKFSSPFGVVNMAGNVWEWIQGKILKGGGFVSEIQGLKIENRSTGKTGEKNGFRCIKQ